MKRIYLNYLTLLIASLFITVFLFVSCKKDRLTGNDFSLKEDESYYIDLFTEVIEEEADEDTQIAVLVLLNKINLGIGNNIK